MGRPAIPKEKKRLQCVKINITNDELKKFNIHKNRLLQYSPTLSAQDVLRKVINNIDDFALIEFLNLDDRHPIKTLLLSNFLLTHIKKDSEV